LIKNYYVVKTATLIYKAHYLTSKTPFNSTLSKDADSIQTMKSPKSKSHHQQARKSTSLSQQASQHLY
ncbi:MAG: hypothetical protein ACKOW9_06400, partial [Candidatus Paceibacterota bacterium]